MVIITLFRHEISIRHVITQCKFIGQLSMFSYQLTTTIVESKTNQLLLRAISHSIWPFCSLAIQPLTIHKKTWFKLVHFFAMHNNSHKHVHGFIAEFTTAITFNPFHSREPFSQVAFDKGYNDDKWINFKMFWKLFNSASSALILWKSARGWTSAKCRFLVIYAFKSTHSLNAATVSQWHLCRSGRKFWTTCWISLTPYWTRAEKQRHFTN